MIHDKLIMKHIFKHKFLIYFLVIILLIVNIATIAIRKNIEEEKISPIFVIYSQKESQELKDLFLKIQNIETTDKASYMYVDPKHARYEEYTNRYGLKDDYSAFMVINQKQEAQGIKKPCPDINFMKEIIEKYNY